MIRPLLLLVILAFPARSEVLCKWIEPRHFDAKTYTVEWEQYWVFEQVYDWNWGFYVYQQHQVTRWAWLEIEIPPHNEGDDEPT